MVDGDTIVVAYDEVTLDNILICLGSPTGGQPDGTASVPGGAFQPAAPPPLAPGLSEPVRAVEPTHAHQLKLLQLR